MHVGSVVGKPFPFCLKTKTESKGNVTQGALHYVNHAILFSYVFACILPAVT